MTGPRPSSYDQSVYARGGYVAAPGAAGQPPAFQRGRPNNQADSLRPHPGRPKVTFLTVAEVAAELRVSKMTVYRLVHAGDLAASRIGRSFRVPARALDEYLANQAAESISKEA